MDWRLLSSVGSAIWREAQALCLQGEGTNGSVACQSHQLSAQRPSSRRCLLHSIRQRRSSDGRLSTVSSTEEKLTVDPLELYSVQIDPNQTHKPLRIETRFHTGIGLDTPRGGPMNQA
jgi:hypothetical protein